jgi:hypothetical protein
LPFGNTCSDICHQQVINAWMVCAIGQIVAEKAVLDTRVSARTFPCTVAPRRGAIHWRKFASMEEKIVHCRGLACNQLAIKCFTQARMYADMRAKKPHFDHNSLSHARSPPMQGYYANVDINPFVLQAPSLVVFIGSGIHGVLRSSLRASKPISLSQL